MGSKSSYRRSRPITRILFSSVFIGLLTVIILIIDFILPCGFGTRGLEAATRRAIAVNAAKQIELSTNPNASSLAPGAPWPPSIPPRRLIINTPPKYNWVIAVLIYNEAQYLLEWIAWHRLLGCDHFYFYDHRSTDGPIRILAPLIERGIVTYIRIPEDAGGVEAADGHESVGKGKPTSYSMAAGLFRKDFPSRIRDAVWASNWDIDEFLILGNEYPTFAHFLATAAARGKGAVGGIKLSRRSASTSGRNISLRAHELAVTTYIDIENELAASKNDPGKVVVRVDLSNSGFLVPHKLFASRGALVNVRGNPSKKRNQQGDSAGIDVPYAPEAPFLVHHITRSYEDCKWKDGWDKDRQGTWRHKMAISICDLRNETSAFYSKNDYLTKPNEVTKMIIQSRSSLCNEMRNLNKQYCDTVACCGER